jgi:hypothetical protein
MALDNLQLVMRQILYLLRASVLADVLTGLAILPTEPREDFLAVAVALAFQGSMVTLDTAV